MEKYCVFPLFLFFSPLMGLHYVAVAQCYAPPCGHLDRKKTSDGKNSFLQQQLLIGQCFQAANHICWQQLPLQPLWDLKQCYSPSPIHTTTPEFWPDVPSTSPSICNDSGPRGNCTGPLQPDGRTRTCTVHLMMLRKLTRHNGFLVCCHEES